MSARFMDTLSKFKERITINKLWKHYKTRAVIARESDHEQWKIILLITIPDKTGHVGRNILLENPAIKFIEEIRSIDNLDTFLEDLFERRTLVIGDTSSSVTRITYSTFLFCSPAH
jgi:hypothetical protein